MIFLFLGIFIGSLALDRVMPGMPFFDQLIFVSMLVSGGLFFKLGLQRMFPPPEHGQLDFYKHLYGDLGHKIIAEGYTVSCTPDGRHTLTKDQPNE